MSNLVVRLRRVFGGGLGIEAADRIEALEAEVEHLKEALAATDADRLAALDRLTHLGDGW